LIPCAGSAIWAHRFESADGAVRDLLPRPGTTARLSDHHRLTLSTSKSSRHLWIGTKRLDRCDPGTRPFKALLRSIGLAPATWELVFGDKAWLRWMSTNNGLSSFVRRSPQMPELFRQRPDFRARSTAGRCYQSPTEQMFVRWLSSAPLASLSPLADREHFFVPRTVIDGFLRLREPVPIGSG